IEATAEVRVNDERISLVMVNSYLLNTNSAPMKADGTPLNSAGAVQFSVDIYGGIDVSTVELSIKEDNNKGRFVFYGKSTGNPIKHNFYYYSADSTQPYYDTNEILTMSAKCPENSNTEAVRPVLIYRPQLSDTIEISDSTNIWRFKKIGYRYNDGVWKDQINYKGNNFIFYHGDGYGIRKANNLVGYTFNYYCGEPIGEHATFYYNGSGDVRNGLLVAKSIYDADFLSYDSSGWEYTTENRYAPGTGYYIGTFQITNKVVEKFTRTSINLSWTSVPGSRIITKYDGWSTQ
ncbi:MAG TPA: hypothetical protein DEA62_02535, partial [Coxiellaceae bacterium]|nr:hypothetical protein [Coxiellaceae bacterium]